MPRGGSASKSARHDPSLLSFVFLTALCSDCSGIEHHIPTFTMLTTRCVYSVALFPGTEEGEEKEHLVYTLFAHVPNYSKGHKVELGACTNVTINSSCEQHKQ